VLIKSCVIFQLLKKLWFNNQCIIKHAYFSHLQKYMLKIQDADIGLFNFVKLCISTSSLLCFLWSKTATSGMMEKINKELQCPICWNRLVQPKLLPCCQHTFCLGCISEYVKGCRNGQTVCPECRASFHLPCGGAAALENNQIANRLLEIIKTC